MYKDFDTCPHCTAAKKSGRIMRMEAKTPLISRSDGKHFHLYLFSGPDPWYAKSGAPIAGRMTTNYFYASDKLKVSHEAVMVMFRTTDLDYDRIVEAMRDAADRIAEILSKGERPEPALYYDGGILSVLDPANRP